MKMKFLALLVAALPFSGFANGPKTEVEKTVNTYIENFFSNNYEEMTSVLHTEFQNQGLNRDGSLSSLTSAKDLKVLMKSQTALNSIQQNNLIEITSITEQIATVKLVTGPANSRWNEYITLVKVDREWKIKNILWSF
jgi:hypothetical protein